MIQTENEEARTKIRYVFKKGAAIKAKVARGKKEAGIKYKDYFDFEEPLKRCPSHRLLAIRRGEEEGARTECMDRSGKLAERARQNDDHQEKRRAKKWRTSRQEK